MEELSAVVLLQRILNDALERNSSDVHLHANTDELVVHFRVSGHLQEYLRLHDYGPAVIRRVKALAKMDVAESRLPQDGSFIWQTDAKRCDIRAAAIPTYAGEAVVLRLLAQQRDPVSFTKLGMTETQSVLLNDLLRDARGLVLVAGATGSGKTTTMYAMMLQLARWGRHVVSIEDPVEMPLADCHQVEVRERIGITFDAGLKALLRHDPDVIMIGEIRDELTARVALRAAMSGHLVLSTTHAGELVGAAARLVDFGLSRTLLGDVLRAVVVQTMVTTACVACLGVNCPKCHGSGLNPERQVRFEILPMTPDIARLFSSNAAWADVRASVMTSAHREGEVL